MMGAGGPPAEWIAGLLEAGYTLTCSSADASGDGLPVVILADTPTCRAVLAGMAQRGGRWLAWNRNDSASLTMRAYEHGASAVLPAAASVQTLLGWLHREQQSSPVVQRLRYQRGQTVRLPAHTLVTIEQGIIAQTLLGSDGSEVLLGLYGADMALTDHPDDKCGLLLVAHTDVVLTLSPWAQAPAPATLERLRARTLLMEAWAAAVARSSVEQQLLGILGVLAEQFGHATADGVCIDVRLTHAQLAAAIGATRPTVTRALGALRDRRAIWLIGPPVSERWCIGTALVPHQHLSIPSPTPQTDRGMLPTPAGQRESHRA